LDKAFTKPRAAHALAGLLEEKGVELVTEFNTGEVDGPGGRLVSYDEREVPFDLAVVIPLHSGAEYVGRSEGLGDAMDFVETDKHTLQSTADPAIFAIGDGANLPASKAGSVRSSASTPSTRNTEITSTWHPSTCSGSTRTTSSKESTT